MEILRWKEHFEDLLKPTSNSTEILTPSEDNDYIPDLPMYPPTDIEMKKALRKLKNIKLPDWIKSAIRA